MKGIINLESIWRRSLKAVGLYYNWLFWREQHLPTIKMKKMRALYGPFVKENDLCFDVGANMGSRVASFVMLKAKVIAIEPQRTCYETLQKIFVNQQVTIVPKGVGAKNENRDFYISDNSLISSFSKEWIQDQKSGHFKNNRWDKKEQIEIVTLDMLIDQYGTPDFIKIDTEGFELEVLNGLSKPPKALSFEYTLPHQKDKAIDCIHVLDRLYQGKVEFNVCRDEAYSMHLAQWIPTAEIIKQLESETFNVAGFGYYGDIYAKAVV